MNANRLLSLQATLQSVKECLHELGKAAPLHAARAAGVEAIDAAIVLVGDMIAEGPDAAREVLIEHLETAIQDTLEKMVQPPTQETADSKPLTDRLEALIYARDRIEARFAPRRADRRRSPLDAVGGPEQFATLLATLLSRSGNPTRPSSAASGFPTGNFLPGTMWSDPAGRKWIRSVHGDWIPMGKVPPPCPCSFEGPLYTVP